MNQDTLLASEWIKLEEMILILEPFVHHTDMLQTDVSYMYVISLECHLQHVPAANTVTISLLSSFWRRLGRLLQPDIVNFNPVPVVASLVDPTVGSCLLAPEMSGLLQAAKLYVIQQALTEAQATDNSHSSVLPAVALLQYQHLCCRSSSFWLLKA